MAIKGWGRSVILAAPLLVMGCVTIDDRFAETAPNEVDVDGKTYDVRVIETAAARYDVQSFEKNRVVHPFGGTLGWKGLYDDGDPQRHASRVDAAKKVLAANHCGDKVPYVKAYSPVPWTALRASFICL